MKITFLNFTQELTVSTMHGIKREWNENDPNPKIGMLVIGVGEMSLDGFVRKTLANPKGIPDNIVLLPLQETKYLNRITSIKSCDSQLHVYLLPDLFSAKEELIERYFRKIFSIIRDHNIDQIYVHGITGTFSTFAYAYFDFWCEKNKLEIGIDNLASSLSVAIDGATHYDNIRAQVEEQRPARGKGKDWFIGDNFEFVDSLTIMKIVLHIHKHPEINRTVVSKKLALKLFHDLVLS